jgi:large subunit ribosomal protein L10
MERAEKQAEVKYLTDCFKQSALAMCAEYRGLTVAQITQLRRKLFDGGAKARVVKNTLARLAAKGTLKGKSDAQLSNFIGMLKGPSLVVFSKDDPVGPAKIMEAFAKDNQALRIKGAWFEGQAVNREGVEALSKMPGKADIYSMLLRVISAPATQMARLLKAPSQQMVQVLEAQRQKLDKK